MPSISEIVKQFKLKWTEKLSPQDIEAVCKQSGQSWIRSLLNPVTMVQRLRR